MLCCKSGLTCFVVHVIVWINVHNPIGLLKIFPKQIRVVANKEQIFSEFFFKIHDSQNVYFINDNIEFPARTDVILKCISLALGIVFYFLTTVEKSLMI